MPEPAPGMQFATLGQQRESANLGVWAFLASEVLFFSGPLAAYAVYRYIYPAGFAAAGSHTEILLGSINTVLLLTSSLFMILAIHAIEAGRQRQLVLFLALAALLGLAFLGVKGIEYAKDYQDGLVPGVAFTFSGPYRRTVELFFFLYFILTGVHSIHLSVGIGLVLFTAWKAGRGAFSPRYHAWVDGVGLYWHFVDAVWLVLYAIIYLGGRNGG